MQDIAQALSNSLDRNGAGGMRAALDMSGYAVRNAAPGVLPTDLATVGQSGVPIGVWLPFGGDAAPDGYLLCFGQAVSRTTYADLFAVLGVKFGSGDGTTTFNIPDLRGNVAVGKDDMGGTAAARLTGATTVGAQLGSQAVTLTEAQMPMHNHAITDPGHSHSIGNQFLATGSGLEAGNGYRIVSGNTGPAATGITLDSAGSGSAHPNVQPSLVSNFIIKATL